MTTYTYLRMLKVKSRFIFAGQEVHNFEQNVVPSSEQVAGLVVALFEARKDSDAFLTEEIKKEPVKPPQQPKQKRAKRDED